MNSGHNHGPGAGQSSLATTRQKVNCRWYRRMAKRQGGAQVRSGFSILSVTSGPKGPQLGLPADPQPSTLILTSPHMTPENGRDRFQRWQKIAIDQLGYALNLILALTIATLGYGFGLLRDEKFIPRSSAKSDVCAMHSGGFGSLWSRLCSQPTLRFSWYRQGGHFFLHLDDGSRAAKPISGQNAPRERSAPYAMMPKSYGRKSETGWRRGCDLNPRLPFPQHRVRTRSYFSLIDSDKGSARNWEWVTSTVRDRKNFGEAFCSFAFCIFCRLPLFPVQTVLPLFCCQGAAVSECS